MCHRRTAAASSARKRLSIQMGRPPGLSGETVGRESGTIGFVHLVMRNRR